MRDSMEGLLYQHGVDAVFTGHVHAYERIGRCALRSSATRACAMQHARARHLGLDAHVPSSDSQDLVGPRMALKVVSAPQIDSLPDGRWLGAPAQRNVYSCDAVNSANLPV